MSDRRLAIIAKIEARCVEVEGPCDTPCLLWTGPDSGKGRGGDYPRMCLDGGTVAVHKAYWVCHNGPIPPRKQLDHICRRRRCIRHTELVTHLKNQRRRDEARRALQLSEPDQ
jgi:hypothetical protein